MNLITNTIMENKVIKTLTNAALFVVSLLAFLLLLNAIW